MNEDYFCQLLDGQREGLGQLIDVDFNYYVGFFKQGYFEGYGKMWYSNKEFYEGEWKNGMRHGQGTLV